MSSRKTDTAFILRFMFALRFLWQKAKLILLRSLLPQCRRSRHVQQKNRYSLYPQVHVCATISLAKSKTDSPKKPATSMPSVKTCPAEKQHRAYRNCPGCRRHGTEGRTLMSLRTLPSKALSSIQRDPPRGSFRIRPSLRTARRTAAVGGLAGVGWMADASFQTRCGCSLTSAPCLTRCAGVIFKCTWQFVCYLIFINCLSKTFIDNVQAKISRYTLTRITSWDIKTRQTTSKQVNTSLRLKINHNLW